MSKGAPFRMPEPTGEPARPVDGASLLQVGEALIEAAGRDPDMGLALARDIDPDATRATRDQWHVATRLATRPGAPSADIGYGARAPLAALARDVRDGGLARWLGDIRRRFSAGRLHRVRPAAMDTPALVRARLAMELAAPGLRAGAGSPAPGGAAEHPHAVRLVFADAGDDAPTLRSRRRRR